LNRWILAEALPAKDFAEEEAAKRFRFAPRTNASAATWIISKKKAKGCGEVKIPTLSQRTR
jgi:hypothetical protein